VGEDDDSGTGNETAVSAESTSEGATDEAVEDAADAALDLSLAEGVQPGSVLELSGRDISIEPTGLAPGWYWRARPERTTPREPETLIYPAHLMIVFGDDNLVEVAANDGRRVLIFPLFDYLDFSAENGLSETGDQVARLLELLDENGEGSAEPRGAMPLLPPPASPVQAWSHYLELDFRNGSGMRYVMEEDEDVYVYQGISEDGRYYVSVLWPLEDGYDDAILDQLDAMVASLGFEE
jgi:hypothetical protein